MKNKRLLVIEDDQELSELICLIAAEMRFTIGAVLREGSFVEIYHNFKPEIIVLDIMMPGMDGFEILRFLAEYHCTARIIIMSAQASYHKMAKKLGEGLGLTIEANLTKPLRLADLRRIFQDIQNTFAVIPQDSAEDKRYHLARG